MRLILLAAVLLLPAAAEAATPVAGRWLTEEGNAVVTVGPCGAQVCGRITRLVKGPPTGAPVDRNNPDPRLRARPLEGLAILTGFADAGDEWRGRIYDPKSGRTYKSVLRRERDGRLEVRGCIAFFCRTQHWTAVR